MADKSEPEKDRAPERGAIRPFELLRVHGINKLVLCDWMG